MSTIELNPADFLVLICDDEEAIRSMLAEAVGGWGFQVATSPNAEAALEYMHAGNVPHILVTDIRMGEMNGIELAHEVKKMSDEVEIVIMTSHGTFETAVQAMRIGVFDYISKPFDNIEDVRTTLLHVAERIYLKFYNEFLVNELEKKNQEISLKAQMSEKLSETMDLAQTLEVGVHFLSQAFGDAGVVFFQYVPSQKALLATTRIPAELFGSAQLAFPLTDAQAESPAAILNTIEGLKNNPEFLMFVEQSMAITPEEVAQQLLPVSHDAIQIPWQVSTLVTRDIARGAFVVLPRTWSEGDSSELFGQYARMISTSFENALLHAKVVQTAIRDSMTGLYNVRFFKERFQQEIMAAKRVQHPLSLLFFDVDYFKKYNDTHGHPAGDKVLKMVAELMRKNFRITDILARYGGEEFVVLMPHTAFVDALEKAESFRKVLEETPFPNEYTQPLGKVTISIGVSEFPSHGADADTVIKMSDDALYEAKKKSRNVVVAARPPEGYVPAFESTSIRTRLPKPPTMRNP